MGKLHGDARPVPGRILFSIKALRRAPRERCHFCRRSFGCRSTLRNAPGETRLPRRALICPTGRPGSVTFFVCREILRGGRRTAAPPWQSLDHQGFPGGGTKAALIAPLT